MKQLIKNGDIILDGTATREQKEQEAFALLEECETIAKELGIDLVVLLKAVRDGVYCKRPFGGIDYEPFRIDYATDYKTNKEYIFVCGMYFKDYKKTWALTKEELE